MRNTETDNLATRTKHQLSLLSMFIVMTCCGVVLGIMVLAGAEVSRAVLQIALTWFFAVCGVPSVSLLMIVGSLRFGSTMLAAEALWWRRLAAAAGSLTLLWCGCGLLFWWLVFWLGVVMGEW